MHNKEELVEVQTNLDCCLADIQNRQQNMEEIRKTILASHTTQSDVEISLKEKQKTKEKCIGQRSV